MKDTCQEVIARNNEFHMRKRAEAFKLGAEALLRMIDEETLYAIIAFGNALQEEEGRIEAAKMGTEHKEHCKKQLLERIACAAGKAEGGKK